MKSIGWKGLVWLTLLVLTVTACRGATTETTVSANQVVGIDLSGLSFDVHQEPG